MTKSTSPIRLQAALLEAAQVSGAVQHRTAAEQIEYWAEIGRKVSRVIDPETLLAVKSGWARIIVESLPPADVDLDGFIASLAAGEHTQAMAAAIAKRSPIRYQACAANPDLLEEIDQTGKKVVGEYVDGEFRPLSRDPS